MNEKYERILQAQQRDWNRIALRMALLVPVIAACFYYVGLFDEKRLIEGIPSIFGLIIENLPRISLKYRMGQATFGYFGHERSRDRNSRVFLATFGSAQRP